MVCQSCADYPDSLKRLPTVNEVMLIRNGVCFYEGPNTAKSHNVWSCSKVFTSTALGLLIADGLCELDTKAAKIDPALAQHYPTATSYNGFIGKLSDAMLR